MPVGRINVQQLAGGAGFTVVRVIDGETWLPLDERDNPTWLTWSNAIQAAAWVYAVKPVRDYPHWGAPPA